MRIAIIGGSGRMGQWFARFLKKDGFEVVISGRDIEKLQQTADAIGVEYTSNEDAVKGADIVLISVPINGFESVAKDISPLVNPGQKIFDVTSVKVQPVRIMHHYFKKNTILGTHPLFGPGAKGLAGMNFVLTPTNKKESLLAQKVQSYLEAKEARVTSLLPAEHDEMMTVVLGLSHFIALAAADTLSGVNLRALEAVGGITFKVLLTLVESVVSEDPELYAAIQTSLSELPEIEERFCRNAATWAEMVKNKDTGEFTARMKELKDLFAANADFGKAYEKMYRIAQSGFQACEKEIDPRLLKTNK